MCIRDRYTLAQKYLGDQSFLTTTLVRDMKTAQVHHIYPKAYLIKSGFTNKNMYNKLGNYVYLHDQVNNKVNDLAPKEYMSKIMNFNGAFGNEIKDQDALDYNLDANAIPQLVVEGTSENYAEFLKERNKLMARKIRLYYEKL